MEAAAVDFMAMAVGGAPGSTGPAGGVREWVERSIRQRSRGGRTEAALFFETRFENRFFFFCMSTPPPPPPPSPSFLLL